jgi:hypothetical protein
LNIIFSKNILLLPAISPKKIEIPGIWIILKEKRKADLNTRRNFVVCPVGTGFLLEEDVRVLGIGELNKIFE